MGEDVIKVIFVWGAEKGPEAMYMCREFAAVVRARHESQMILATCRRIQGCDVSWADKVFQSVQFKHTGDGATSPWGYLHREGLTAPDLRESVFRRWYEMFSAEKPDLVVSVGDYSSIVVASMMSVRSLYLGAGAYLPDQGLPLPSPYPELSEWVYRLSGYTLDRLLERPSVVFLDERLDVDRKWMSFNPPMTGLDEKASTTPYDAIAVWDRRHPETPYLLDACYRLWKDKFVMIDAKKGLNFLLENGGNEEKRPVIISHGNPLIMSYALQTGCPQLVAPTTPFNQLVSKKAFDKRYAMNLGTYKNGEWLTLQHMADNLELFRAQSAGQKPHAFVELDAMLPLLLGKGGF